MEGVADKWSSDAVVSTVVVMGTSTSVVLLLLKTEPDVIPKWKTKGS